MTTREKNKQFKAIAAIFAGRGIDSYSDCEGKHEYLVIGDGCGHCVTLQLEQYSFWKLTVWHFGDVTYTDQQVAGLPPAAVAEWLAAAFDRPVTPQE